MKSKSHLTYIMLIIQALFIVSGCEQSTNVNSKNLSDSTIYVIEKDHLFGGFGGVDNYHETLIINTSEETVSLTVESPLPDTLKHSSLRSPAFGLDAIIPTPYQDFFDLPNINKSSYTNKPDLSTTNSYFWKNLSLEPSDLMEVPYSNYYGDDGRIFIKNFGTSQFLYLNIISDYSIKKDTVDSNYINIEIKETLQNVTHDTLYRLDTHLFVPRELNLSSGNTKLYNLISDTLISLSSTKWYLYNETGTNEGFGFFANGEEMHPARFILPPYQSCQFVFKMTIEPLLDKFEIYPSYGVTFIKPGGNKIWPGSIIIINGKRYDGQVHYLKEVGIVSPTYILFSINKDLLRVVSPDEIVPTFIPQNIKPQGR